MFKRIWPKAVKNQKTSVLDSLSRYSGSFWERKSVRRHGWRTKIQEFKVFWVSRASTASSKASSCASSSSVKGQIICHRIVKINSNHDYCANVLKQQLPSFFVKQEKTRPKRTQESFEVTAICLPTKFWREIQARISWNRQCICKWKWKYGRKLTGKK